MDQDDSMLSSHSSQDDEIYDDDNLFPDSMAEHGDIQARAQTPQNDHLNASAPGELSPPRSQSTMANAARMREDTEDLSPTAANRTVLPLSEEEWKPGSGWKSKKAQEDLQRAWDNVVDKDFTTKDFGDVIAQQTAK